MRRDDGFSRLEALIAVSVFTIGVGSLAQLIVLATHVNQRSRELTLATLLAHEKVEQLKAMAWGTDVIGLGITDITSNTAVIPEAGSGGTGLAPSPADALTENMDGYCDFADAAGRLLSVVAVSSVAPAGTVFIRRWSVTLLSANTLFIRVRVLGATTAPGILAQTATVRARRGLP